MLEAALVYAEMGRRVHPCRPEDKRPYTRWGQAASSNPHHIRWMWRQWPNALIAVCTGDGLVVVDDDRGLVEPDPDLADTLTCRTRSRGWHHWYSTTERISNAVNLLPGIDVRGHGGYVIAPPSPGWEWVNANAQIQPLPTLLRAALQPRSPGGWGQGFEPAGTVAEGGRNDYIARFTGYAIRALDGPSESTLLQIVREHNDAVCVPPLPDDEVVRTTRSILRRHERG